MPVGGLGVMRQPYQGGLGRRPRWRFAEGDVVPNPDGTMPAHGNILADGTFIGPDGKIWGADAGSLAVSEIAAANEERPEMQAMGLVQASNIGGYGDFAPDWQAPTNFNPADVPPPPADGSVPTGPGANAGTAVLQGAPGMMQNTIGDYYGVGPGDQGWSRAMAQPQYFIWDSPAGPRVIDRLAQDTWTHNENLLPPNGPGGPGAVRSGRSIGWPLAVTPRGYTILGYPGDVGGWVPRGYEGGSSG